MSSRRNYAGVVNYTVKYLLYTQWMCEKENFVVRFTDDAKTSDKIV